MDAHLAGIHHLALCVRDLARVEPFYRDLLGLPVLRRWPEADGQGCRSVWLELGTGRGAFLALEVVPAGDLAAAAPEAQPGWHMMVLPIVPSARRTWITRLHAAGVPVYHHTPYTIYVRDPEGNRVGLSHWPEAADDGDSHV